jgi:hypothetical protein
MAAPRRDGELTMIYRVKAWGAKDYPDLDYETHDVPTDLGWKYPCYSVACLTAIPATAFAAALDAQEDMTILHPFGNRNPWE